MRKNQVFFILYLVALLVCFNCMEPICNAKNMALIEAETTEEEQVKGPAIDLHLTSPSYVLLEASTGKVIMEKNASEKRSPASITKIMTLILIFDALEQNQISLSDEVVTSAYAKSMGGSQVFLEEGEKQSVETLIKCITVASGNDASVAMAEFIAGSEEAFVDKMNQKANTLGLLSTHFVDCCGLTSSDEHYTSALDVAKMSQYLITNYPKVFDYTQIWMEDITHNTNKGSSNFTLSSTNKLLKQYPWTTGLKTGSTKKAGYCLSATAMKDDISLVAVIMAAPDFRVRFSEAKALLEYGYANCKLYQDQEEDNFPPVAVDGGVKENVNVSIEEKFRYLDTEGLQGELKREISLVPTLKAPISKGMQAGTIIYRIGNKEIGTAKIITTEEIERATFGDYFKKAFLKLLL